MKNYNVDKSKFHIMTGKANGMLVEWALKFIRDESRWEFEARKKLYLRLYMGNYY